MRIVVQENGAGGRGSATITSASGAIPGAAYCPEIDGLRAIAVLAVLFHHLTPRLLPGGFVGVDIFFVISGFLITAHVDREAAAGAFSFCNFYKRRINRILPALFAVLATTAIACVVLLSPGDLRLFAQSAVFAAIGLSNFFFWQKYGNYFAAKTAEAPLLHTWSLGVEEQFYAVWPLLVVLSRRMRPRRRLLALAGLTVFAFALSQLGSGNLASASYYLLPTRFFELMIGGLLALAPHAGAKIRGLACEAASLVGFALIASSLILLNRNSRFPGLNALWPCLGAALLIWAGSRSRLGYTLLTLRPIVFVGVISYSVYLWHWPLICLLGYAGITLHAAGICLVAAASILLGWLSWKFIEAPLRRSGARISFGRVFVRRFAVPGAAILAFALLVAATRGLPQRFTPEVARLDAMRSAQPELLRSGCHVPTALYATPINDNCRLGAPKPQPDGLLLGDSFANHFSGMIDVMASAAGLTFTDYTMDACPPILNYDNGKSGLYAGECIQRNRHAYDELARRGFKRVILAANWPRDPSAGPLLAASISTALAAGVQVTVIVANTAISDAASCPVRKLMYGQLRDCRAPQSSPPPYLAQIRRQFPQVKFIDPNVVLCDPSGLCNPVLSGKLLYRDDGHLNDIGSREIGRELLLTGETL